MCYVAELPGRGLPTWHGHKQPVVAVDNAHIMDDEGVFDCYRDYGLHSSFVADLADAHISNIHDLTASLHAVHLLAKFYLDVRCPSFCAKFCDFRLSRA